MKGTGESGNGSSCSKYHALLDEGRGFLKWGYPQIDGFCEGNPSMEDD